MTRFSLWQRTWKHRTGHGCDSTTARQEETAAKQPYPEFSPPGLSRCGSPVPNEKSKLLLAFQAGVFVHAYNFRFRRLATTHCPLRYKRPPATGLSSPLFACCIATRLWERWYQPLRILMHSCVVLPRQSFLLAFSKLSS